MKKIINLVIVTVLLIFSLPSKLDACIPICKINPDRCNPGKSGGGGIRG